MRGMLQVECRLCSFLSVVAPGTWKERANLHQAPPAWGFGEGLVRVSRSGAGRPARRMLLDGIVHTELRMPVWQGGRTTLVENGTPIA